MDTAFDRTTLWQLRVSASLATALPVRVVVSDGPGLLFEVRRPPLPDRPAQTRVPPCWFRTVVAGIRVVALASPDPLVETMRCAQDLRIAVELEHAGASLDGGIWRLDHAADFTFVFATGLAAFAARAAVGDEPDVAALEPGFLHDPATGVTLVSATAAHDEATDAVHDTVLEMLGRCEVVELLAEARCQRP